MIVKLAKDINPIIGGLYESSYEIDDNTRATYISFSSDQIIIQIDDFPNTQEVSSSVPSSNSAVEGDSIA